MSQHRTLRDPGEKAGHGGRGQTRKARQTAPMARPLPISSRSTFPEASQQHSLAVPPKQPTLAVASVLSIPDLLEESGRQAAGELLGGKDVERERDGLCFNRRRSLCVGEARHTAGATRQGPLLQRSACCSGANTLEPKSVLKRPPACRQDPPLTHRGSACSCSRSRLERCD